MAIFLSQRTADYNAAAGRTRHSTDSDADEASVTAFYEAGATAS